MSLAIIRQLPGCRPILHAIVEDSKDPDVDDQADYLSTCADEEIKRFRKQFPEFNTAIFHIQDMESVQTLSR